MKAATIISDASFNPKSGAAGWSAWAKADGKDSVTYTNAFKTKVTDSTHAELMAICNVLWITHRSGYLERKMEILIQSDSVLALSLVRVAIPEAVERKHANGVQVPFIMKPSFIKRFDLQIDFIKMLVQEFEPTLQIRHVRGHASGPGRHWVNRFCDKQAKIAMRTVIKERQ